MTVSEVNPRAIGLCTPAAPATLAPGASLVCAATHTVTQGDIDLGHYANIASADSNETDPDSELVTTPIVQKPGLTVQKRAISAGPYESVGDLVVYSLTATNTGNTTLTGVTITDVGAGAVLVACSVPIPATLAPGALVDCTVNHRVTQADLDAGHYTNVATGHSDQTPSTSDDETVPTAPPPSPTPPVTPSTPSISLAKSPIEQTIERAATASWTITVTNTGDVTLTNVTVSDTQAPGCARTSATLPALASMSPKASVSYTCTLANVSASFTNVAVATGTPPSGANVSANASADVTVRLPLLPPTPKPKPKPVTHPSIMLEKSPSSQTVSLGGTATFRITVTNNGDVALTHIKVSDPRSPDCSRDLRTLAAGASKSYTCTRRNVHHGFVNTARVAAATATGKTVGHSASVPVKVSAPFVPESHPAIRIVNGPNSQRTGYKETARFRITVTNTGNVRLRNVKVADPAAPACNRALGTLAAGATKTYFCTRPNVTKSFLNRARAIGTAPNGRRVTDTDSAAVTTKKPVFTG